MYVLTYSYDEYSAGSILAASPDLSKLEAFLHQQLVNDATEVAQRNYVNAMMDIWDEHNPYPVCPFYKPDFDKSRAHDKEYIKERNAGPIAQYHKDMSRWNSQVRDPWNNSRTEMYRKYAEDAKTANLKLGGLDDMGYSIEHVLTV